MNFTFTPEEEIYAQKIVNKLYRHKRFFLPKGVNVDNPLPHLPITVFGELYDLHQRQEDFYERLTLGAELTIREEEAKLGIKPHKITDGQRLAQCNRFYGGLEIFAIVPLDSLTEIIGESAEGLSEELFQNWHHKNEARQMNRRVDFDTYMVALENEMFDFPDSRSGEKLLVVLGTRFNCAHKQLLSERIGGLVTYPHLTSYFMYKIAHSGIRLSPHMTTVFGELGNHVSMDFFPGHARITPVSSSNYEERIAFATIL